jgi:hypothetical protein
MAAQITAAPAETASRLSFFIFISKLMATKINDY